MTSTYDLVSHIPAYMVEILSAHILGKTADSRKLAEGLSDEARLERILEGLTARQTAILLDLYELGGSISWDLLTALYLPEYEQLRQDLTFLGSMGIVFQGGLSGRDPIILLPSMYPLLEEKRKRYQGNTGDFTWREPRKVSISGHIALLNILRVSGIRCKAGMEPFKRGWQILEERLGPVADYERLYWELVELGCIREFKGVLRVSQQASSEFAADGDARYPVWRFIRSCRPYPGLDHKVHAIMADRALREDYFSRALTLFIISRNPDEVRADGIVHSLIEEWLDLGVLQRDDSGRWLRLSEHTFSALKTGRIQVSLHAYSEDVVIQPNMEILAPGDFDPVDLLNLGEMADLVRSDVVSIYQITKRSITRALHLGWDAEKIRGFLERISRHELPDNVAKTVQGWILAHTEACILRGTFLVLSRTDDRPPRGLSEVLPGIYRIPGNCEEEVLAQLSKNDVIVRGAILEDESGEGAGWGRMTPVVPQQKSQWKEARREGVFPFGMVTPLPYGTKGEGIFEKALHDGRDVVIFYPRQGYGEIQVKRISPLYLFRKDGIPFVEAFCEDTGEGETFDITKVRALLMDS